MANIGENKNRLIILMLVHRRLSRLKLRLRRRQNLFFMLSCLHYLRIKSIQNQRRFILTSLTLPTRKRRYWMINYNQFWFETLWNQRRDDVVKDIWKRDFRMSVNTFEEILNMTTLTLQCADTNIV